MTQLLPSTSENETNRSPEQPTRKKRTDMEMLLKRLETLEMKTEYRLDEIERIRLEWVENQVDITASQMNYLIRVVQSLNHYIEISSVGEILRIHQGTFKLLTSNTPRLKNFGSQLANSFIWRMDVEVEPIYSIITGEPICDSSLTMNTIDEMSREEMATMFRQVHLPESLVPNETLDGMRRRLEYVFGLKRWLGG
ncbi:hypothetical protein XA68_16880 [Ophiocordyceps unilateralis]|uniref:Uncharacterized protein n=1 Tax=Ophiocordyceps unilateralis TaxID=268505 RepID=A0A2A9P5S3_OPHUN|nr:hypothetical protein XA68_16880 [Ophiocordyceps unilateralis]